ncbi:L,D-transpeptidase catalytic domain [Caloramator proteoclasticus DSM 10124]|uniref:L,D-transpeptidase catalytic domain n=2 Tax=Clostridiaceae TaxID=31979 RepID=A0A1M4V7D7_9CLOT|nr:L,D-transpeptidase catalytic domain [Caloramator proteoclasticus DSM 10124]
MSHFTWVALFGGMEMFLNPIKKSIARTSQNKYILIRLNQRRLYLIVNEKVFFSFKIAIGKKSTPTPKGQFKIIDKALNPGGAFGTRWMRFYKGYGIHGTNNPSSIGYAITNGCVRMYNKDIERLFPLVPVGTKVIITD